MTCVGFCLNVLNGFHEMDYLSFQDWSTLEDTSTGFIKWFCDRNNLTIDQIPSDIRRITPQESLVSCFFDNMPISKKQIDKKMKSVTDRFSQFNQN